MKLIQSKTMRILFLIFLFPGALSASSPVTLEKGREIYPLGLHAEYLEDQTGKLTFEEVISPANDGKWKTSKKENLSFGYTTYAYWVRLQLDHAFQATEKWVLEVGYCNLDLIDFYVSLPGGRWKHTRSGDMFPYKQREFRYLDFHFSLPGPYSGTQQVYLRVESTSSIVIPLTLYSQKALGEKEENGGILLGLFYGIMIVMLLYNLFIYTQIKERSYIYYVLYLFSVIGFQASLQGLSFKYLWPESTWWRNHDAIFFVAWSLFFSILFARSFLQTKEYTPRIDLFFKGALVLFAVSSIIALIFGHRIGSKITSPLIMVVFPVLLVAAVFSLRKGNRSALYYLIASTMLIFGGTLFAWRSLGLVASNLLTDHAIQMGITLEIVLLSLGLGDRFNQEKKERLLAQKEAIDNLHKADRLKDEFLAVTSHELRTPLNGIIGLADSMLQGIGAPHNEQTLSNLRMISSSGRHLAHLVNDILDFSRLRHRDIVLHKKAVDLNPMVEMVFRFSRSLMGDKEIELINECGALPLLLADENRLEQILYNLIDNAVKFTGEGSVTVSAKETAGFAEISVCDTGIGIPEDKLDIIFESFQQGDVSISRKYSGTGLGLSITKNLVELHGGTIRVESPSSSKPDAPTGSCFIFTIPLADEKALTEVQDTGGEKIRRFLRHDLALTDTGGAGGLPDHSGGYSILAVDDDIINLKVIENHLSLKGYRVITARNGTRALEILEEEEKVHLVLLDLMMPGLNGYEVCRIIREKYNPNELPVIILTAKNNLSDLTDGLAFGANDFISKPFSFPELTSRVENQVKMSRFYLNIKDLNENLERKIEERTAELKETMVELRSANTAKNKFLSIISHDLRGPIGNLAKVFNSVAGKGSDISDTLFQQLRETTISVSHMLEDLLIWAALQREKLDLKPENFDVCKAVNLAADPMRLLARSRKITLNLPDENQSLKVFAESRSVITVLRNLISNAIKYTPAGGSIAVDVKRENDTVKISVKDTGRGIPEEKLKELLGPEKADSVKINKKQVSGFGLMLCRYFIEANGGEIGAESVINRGSTFWFRLPAGEGRD